MFYILFVILIIFIGLNKKIIIIALGATCLLYAIILNIWT